MPFWPAGGLLALRGVTPVRGDVVALRQARGQPDRGLRPVEAAMAAFDQHPDAVLASLPMPLRNVGIDRVLRPAELMDGQLFGLGGCHPQFRSGQPRVECARLDVAGLPLLVGRTTPIDAWEQGQGAFSVTMCFSGAPRYGEGATSLAVGPGEVLLNPRTGGRISTGYLASVNFPISHSRLERTLSAMQMGDFRPDLDRPHLFPAAGTRQSGSPSSLLFSFLAFVDELLAEGAELGAALGLDEQLHRLVALSMLRLSGAYDKVQSHWAARRRRWSASLDDLVSYIRAHAHLPLTLTDLEVQSCYSARHLQTLFRDRFDCTPMQFVRRQRLTLAMEQLQAAAPGDTVTRIARACGYRYTSNFSCDFQREFGVTASSVLRGSRSGRGGGLKL